MKNEGTEQPLEAMARDMVRRLRYLGFTIKDCAGVPSIFEGKIFYYSVREFVVQMLTEPTLKEYRATTLKKKAPTKKKGVR